MSAAITTIIPTYGRAGLLRRALRSVLRQTFGDFRVCVYDNASPDDTAAVVATTAAGDPRVVYYRHERNIGGGPNFLFGMRRVDTPFFSFLSDDDVLLPRFFETALQGFTRHPSALLSAASTVEVDAAGSVRYQPLALWRREGLYDPPSGAFAMLDNRHPTWTTILFRREALDQVGYLDLDVGGPSDLDYELRVAARFPIAVAFAPCGAYVSHAAAGSFRETVAVADGFERMRSNVAADERIDAPVRRMLARRLERQLRMKLLEIWGKSLVRGDDADAVAAATAMRARYGPKIGGMLLQWGARVCARVPAARAALRAFERARLRRRALPASTALSPDDVAAIREALAA